MLRRCVRVKYLVDCFHMKGAIATCQKSLQIFWFCFALGSSAPDRKASAAFLLISKNLYSENLWKIFSVVHLEKLLQAVKKS